MSFASLLIQTALIEDKSTVRSGYETDDAWTTVSAAEPCRQNTRNTARTQDGVIRTNTDEDQFFFLPTAPVKRSHRLTIDGKKYDVVKVNKVRDSSAVHHLEVIARLTDHD